MSGERRVSVVLDVDVDQLIAELQHAAHAAGRLRWAAFLGRTAHGRRHHRRETPARAAMHAAYDRRRRARRRRR